MKKLLVILIALALLVGVSAPAFAVTTGTSGGSGLGTLRSVTLVNNANAAAVTSISTSTIIPGKVKLLGYDVICIDAVAEGTVALYDAATANGTYLIGEVEATTSLPISKIFPQGMNVQTGITVSQGSYTSVTVYYVQDQG